MRHTSLIAILLITALVLAAQAATIVVDLNGTGDFAEIAPAIDAASVGDTVLVLPGYYQGVAARNVDFNGKNIVLKSRDGYEATTLDPYSGFYNVLHFANGEGREAVVEGFTITHAVQRALNCHGASPTIRACRFTDNYTNTWEQMFTRTNAVGGASYSSMLIEDCVFEDNYGAARIPVMSFHHCQGVTIRRCSFARNREGGYNIYDDPNGVIVFWESDDILIEECDFTENDVQDCCVSVWGTGDVDILDCTFAGNTVSCAPSTEGLLHFVDSGPVEIFGCTVSKNLVVDSCVSVNGSSTVSIDHCDIVGNSSASSGAVRATLTVGGSSREAVNLSSSVLAFNAGPVPIACEGALPAISACVFYETGDADAMCQPYDPETLVVADPLFCDFYTDDYRLCLNSPCLVPNNDWGIQVGAYYWGCDDCDSPVEATSWGAIKALYR